MYQVIVVLIRVNDEGIPPKQLGCSSNTLLSCVLHSGRLRPLWPALGIIGVGIFVALFIIIGHFVDKAIERSQTEPRNPGEATH